MKLVANVAKSTYAQNWTTTTAPVANWVSVASSADGKRLAALVQGGEAVYTSTNAGADWTLSSPANGGVQGDSIACSADGGILFIAGSTQVYHSTNSGATWIPTASPSESWTSIACSADGTLLAGASAIRRSSTAGIFTSPDGGATWTFTTAPSANLAGDCILGRWQQTSGSRRQRAGHLHLDRRGKHLEPTQSAYSPV